MQKTILIFRLFFFGLCMLGSWMYLFIAGDESPLRVFIIGASIGGLVILIDVYIKGFSLSGFSALTFGLAMGGLFSYMIASSPLFEPLADQYPEAVYMVRLAVTVVMMYLGAVIALRGRDEFYLVIPYVRFDPKYADQPITLIDTSALIDGRVEAICRSRWLTYGLVIPSFVLQELHRVADSGDPRRRERGRRGLKVLNEMKLMTHLDLRIHEVDLGSGERVDEKLVFLAKNMRARLLTTDYNLAQMAQFRGVDWLNLNELSQALLPDVEIGQSIRVELIREGKDSHQAVGYLRDGSMVVVNHGRKLIGSTVEVEITSIVPSSAGKVIFAEYLESSRLEDN